MTSTALYVENDDDDAELLESTLEGSNVILHRVINLNQASRHQGEYEVLLLDLGLDETHGIGSVLEARSRFPTTPIVVMSASEDEVLMEQCISVGADDFLVKGQTSPRRIERAIRFARERRARVEAQSSAATARTEAKAATREAEFQQNVIRALAHELNTPLTPLVLRVATLERHDDPKVRQAAHEIRRNMGRLRRSAQNAVALTKMADQKGTVTATRKIELQDAITSVFAELQEMSDERDLEIRLDLMEAHVMATPESISHLLGNLLKNAVREGESFVSVVMQRQERMLILDIENDGTIHPEIAHNLFRPFINRYAPDTAHAPSWGPGLGLYVANGLARSLQGDLRLLPSNNVRFRLSLPLAESQE